MLSEWCEKLQVKYLHVFHFAEQGYGDISEMQEVPHGQKEKGSHLKFLTFD